MLPELERIGVSLMYPILAVGLLGRVERSEGLGRVRGHSREISGSVLIDG